MARHYFAVVCSCGLGQGRAQAFYLYERKEDGREGEKELQGWLGPVVLLKYFVHPVILMLPPFVPCGSHGYFVLFCGIYDTIQLQTVQST